MENLNVTDAQRVLFNLIGHNLFSKPLEINESVDWNAVIKESILQSNHSTKFRKLCFLVYESRAYLCTNRIDRSI